MSNQKNVPIAPNMGNQRHVSIVPNMVREKRQLASNPPETNIGVDGRSDTPTLSSKPIAADKSRRPKACTNCRKSKIKCIKDTNDQTCKRCKAQGLQCVYEYKVASYKYADRNSLIEETPINSQINNQVHTKAKSAKNSTILPLINIGNNQHENIPIPHVNHLLHPLPKIGQAATVSNTDSIPLGAQQHQIQASSASLLSKAGTDSLNVINNNQLQSIPRLLNPVNDSRSNTISAQNYQEDNQASKSIIMTNELNKWEKSVENRFDDLGSTLATVLSLLQEQKSKNEQVDTVSNPNQNRSIDTTNSPTNHKRQKFEIQEKEVPMKPSLSRASSNSNYSVTSLDALEDFDLSDPVTTLNKILSREDARELFSFFNTNISPQLFGFDISKYSIDDIWDTCPLLIATIGCISSIHHPFLSNVSPYLEKIIYEISKDILFNIPKTESEAFNTIMALCFCGFWFKNNQMFTGLAIQLARTMNLISPHNIKGKKGAKSIIPRKDRLKLWYLLYILDGQQSLVFNRQSMFDSHDETFKNGKQLLIAAENDSLDDDDDDDDSVDMQKVDSVSFNTSYADIRLISQVEYHQAVNAVFEGGAWDLLTPSSFGIPFKTNLELDKWMVQWTVLLSPFNNHPIWSSKSTLIYYNFAKMHINSSAVRKFHVKGFDLPKFDELEDDFYHASFSSDISKKYIEELHTHDVNHYDNEDDDTDDTDDIDDSLDMAKELSPIQSRKVSAELALSAAETVLNIVLGDADILSVLKYVPIHIHIMLYYSALLILKPHACLDGNGNFFDKYENDEERFEASLNAMKLVKRLRHSIIVNSPTDKEFSRKIVDSLTGILHDKVVQIKAELGRSVTDMNVREICLQELEKVVLDNDAQELYHHHRRKQKNLKISAWPGIDAGHPSKSRSG